MQLGKTHPGLALWNVMTNAVSQRQHDYNMSGCGSQQRPEKANMIKDFKKAYKNLQGFITYAEQGHTKKKQKKNCLCGLIKSCFCSLFQK